MKHRGTSVWEPPVADFHPPHSLPLSSAFFFSLFNNHTVFHSTGTAYYIKRSSIDGHLGCFQPLASVNKVAMNNLVEHFLFLRMPREFHDAKWKCFKCQWAYAFVILINSAKLPSREVAVIYTSTNNVWEILFLRILANVVCYQTFKFLPIW